MRTVTALTLTLSVSMLTSRGQAVAAAAASAAAGRGSGAKARRPPLAAPTPPSALRQQQQQQQQQPRPPLALDRRHKRATTAARALPEGDDRGPLPQEQEEDDGEQPGPIDEVGAARVAAAWAPLLPASAAERNVRLSRALKALAAAAAAAAANAGRAPGPPAAAASPEQAYAAFKAAAREFVGGALPADRFRALFLGLFGGGGGKREMADVEAVFVEMALLVPSAERRLELLRLAPAPFAAPVLVAAPAGGGDPGPAVRAQPPRPPAEEEQDDDDGEDDEDEDSDDDDNEMIGAGYYGNEGYDDEEEARGEGEAGDDENDKDEDEDEDEDDEGASARRRRRLARAEAASPADLKESDVREMTGWQVLDRTEIKRMAAQMDAPCPAAGAGMGRAARAAASAAVRAAAEAALPRDAAPGESMRARPAGRSRPGAAGARLRLTDGAKSDVGGGGTGEADPAARPNAILWLRGHDLRLHDNPALLEAARRAAATGGGLVVAYVRDDHLPGWADGHERGAPSPSSTSDAAWRPGAALRAWREAGLRALDASLRRRYGPGLGVVFLKADAATGGAAGALRRIADAVAAGCVVYNARNEPREQAADAAVAAALSSARQTQAGGEGGAEADGSDAGGATDESAALELRCVPGLQLLREPSLVTMDARVWMGGHWGTFTPFLKAWEKAGGGRIADAAKAPPRLPPLPGGGGGGVSALEAAVREAQRILEAQKAAVAAAAGKSQEEQKGEEDAPGASRRLAAAERRLAAARAARDAAAGGLPALGLHTPPPSAVADKGGVDWAERMLREAWTPTPGAATSNAAPAAAVLPASEEAALLALDRFLDPSSASGGGGIRRYDAERNRADGRAVSRLSPYLRSGQLSARLVWQRLRQANAQALSRAFGRRLVWRELAYWQLRHWPDLAVTGVRGPGYWDDDDRAEAGAGAGGPALVPAPAAGADNASPPAAAAAAPRSWRSPGAPSPAESAQAARLLGLWQRGRTGYPLVDAGMRQLRREGWMPQGVRMLCAAWLAHAARLPWHHGARWFHDCLVDGDAAINAMMWANAAGAGLDQWDFDLDPSGPAGRAADPDGAYVRRWVPELRGLGPAAAAGAGAAAAGAAERAAGAYCRAPWRAPAEVLEAAGVRLGETYPARALLEVVVAGGAAAGAEGGGSADGPSSADAPLSSSWGARDGDYAAARAAGVLELGRARAARARVVDVGAAAPAAGGAPGGGGDKGGKGGKGSGGGGGGKKQAGGGKKGKRAAAAAASQLQESRAARLGALLDARGYDVIATPPGSTPKSDGCFVPLFTTEANRKSAAAAAARPAAAASGPAAAGAPLSAAASSR